MDIERTSMVVDKRLTGKNIPIFIQVHKLSRDKLYYNTLQALVVFPKKD